jgi:hypothetical protein
MVPELPHYSSIEQRVQSCTATRPNTFGLFRSYNTLGLPSHDPEEHVTVDTLSNINDSSSQPSNDAFYPFPNLNAFRLGDWYWNGGTQKSQSSFQTLLDIVGDPGFQPADVGEGTRWKDIHHKLALDGEWVDEDTGWERTPVTIAVPFQPRRGVSTDTDAGPTQFTVADFYHRSLVSVIREKLSKRSDDDLFHYEPYHLKWQTTGSPTPINVYGELYTSEAFIHANQELQSSPGEPNCNAPRHIVGLMFASDATHLTSFGDASLWPLYLFFGNESKYRRCKPTCRLANHVAYFQKVPPFLCRLTFYSSFNSFQTLSKNLQPTRQLGKMLPVTPS